jgi:predicted component of type VI protein secretion system
MPAQLVSLSDSPSILLDKPILLIGRHPECDIQIDSRKVSRRHCCIAQVSDYLVVRDLGSTNGIRINGVRVLEGRLKANDELTIGGNRYQVSWEVLPVAAHSPGHAAAHRFEAAPRMQAAVSEDDDLLLEAADEPIPLSEPMRPEAPLARPRRDVPAARAVEPPPRSVERRDDARPKPRSGIVPEKLDLAPGSDAKSRVPPPALNGE